MAAPRNILMLAFPDAQLLDITGPLQMFAGANDELSRNAYAILIAAPEIGPFATSSGVQLVADISFAQVTSRRLARINTLIATGGNEGVRVELQHGAVTRIVAKAVGRVPRIASVCSGAFFLAAAGVLDGRRATTHWRAVDALKRFRPEIEVDGDAIHVEDRGVWTSAGVTAGMDLALAMIEADHGRALALAIARRHVVFRIRPGGQSQFSSELAAQSPRYLQRLASGPWCVSSMKTTHDLVYLVDSADRVVGTAELGRESASGVKVEIGIGSRPRDVASNSWD